MFLDKTGKELCPVAAYLSVRGRDPGPFFRFHSFRISVATTGAAVGLDDAMIKTLCHCLPTSLALEFPVSPSLS